MILPHSVHHDNLYKLTTFMKFSAQILLGFVVFTF